MLALARTFAKTHPARTLRFVAFANEEPPLFQTKYMGSLVYAKRSRERGETIILMLSLETIGYYSDKPGSQHLLFPLNLIYPSTGNFIAFVSNVENGFLVRQLVGSFRQQAEFPSEGGALWGLPPGGDGDRYRPLPLSRLSFECRQARARSVRTNGARRFRPAGCHHRDGERTKVRTD
jgi:Zn-dependent M28 family amino/carboxypeptidase